MLAMPAQQLLVIAYEQDTVEDLAPQTMVGDTNHAEADNGPIELIEVLSPATSGTTLGIETPTAQSDLLRPEASVAEMNTVEAETGVPIATFRAAEVGQGHLTVGMGDTEAVALWVGRKIMMHTYQYRGEMLGTCQRSK